jgi:hypothetical protein
MKADTMPATPPNCLHITLHIRSLGQIPKHQETKSAADKIATYFNDGICDEPLAHQLKHFGKSAATKMVQAELTSWLEDLGAEPTDIAVTELS